VGHARSPGDDLSGMIDVLAQGYAAERLGILMFKITR
jgi:hypothetical protein